MSTRISVAATRTSVPIRAAGARLGRRRSGTISRVSAPDDAPRVRVPQWTPTPRELDDLDLLVLGCFAPALDGFVAPDESPRR